MPVHHCLLEDIIGESLTENIEHHLQVVILDSI